MGNDKPEEIDGRGEAERGQEPQGTVTVSYGPLTIDAEASLGTPESETGDGPTCTPHPAFTEDQQLLLDTLGVDPWPLSQDSVERLAEGLHNAEVGLRLSSGDVMAQAQFKGRAQVDASHEAGDAGQGIDVMVTGEGYELRLSQSYTAATETNAYSLSFTDNEGAEVVVSNAATTPSAEGRAVREYTDQVLERPRNPEVAEAWERQWMSPYLDAIEGRLREADMRSPSGAKLEVTDIYALSCVDNVMARPRFQEQHLNTDHPRSPYDGRPVNVYDVHAKVTWVEKLSLPASLPAPLPVPLPGMSTDIDVRRTATIKIGSVIPETGEVIDAHERVAGEPGLINEGLGPIEWAMDAIDGVALAKFALKFAAKKFAEKVTKEALETTVEVADDLARRLDPGDMGVQSGHQSQPHRGAESPPGVPDRTSDEVDEIVNGIVEADTVQPGHGGMSFRHARGYEGEQGMGFYYSQDKGWAFIEGPSGSGGHRPNQRGPDGVAFTTDGPLEIQILDNKSLASDKPVSSATALTKNLEQNLDALAKRVNDPSMNDVPRIAEIRESITAARDAVASGQPLPDNVHLTVTNSGSTHIVDDVGPTLKDSGVEFRDIQTPESMAAGPVKPDGTDHGAGKTDPPTGKTEQDSGTSGLVAGGLVNSMHSPAKNEEEAKSEDRSEESASFNMEEAAARQSLDMEKEAQQGEFRMDLELFTELPDGDGRFAELPDHGQPAQTAESDETAGTDGAEEGG